MASILLVDDDEDLTEIVGLHISAAGHQVKTASSGNEAFAIWETEKFDVVVTDMRMPNGTGLDLLKKIRSKSSDFPVVIMTGFSNELDLATDFHPQATLVKPVPVSELIQIIGSFAPSST